MLNLSDIRIHEDGAYNGCLHSAYISGLTHSLKTTSEFRFPVCEPQQTANPEDGDVTQSDWSLDYVEMSLKYAQENQKPAHNIELPTPKSKIKELIRTNEDRIRSHGAC